MSSYFKEDVLANENRLNLNELNFRVAFTVEAVYADTLKFKNDPRYVKYVVR